MLLGYTGIRESTEAPGSSVAVAVNGTRTFARVFTGSVTTG